MKTLQEFRRYLLRNKLSLVGFLLVNFILLVAVFAPWIAPSPKEGRGVENIDHIGFGPGWHHWMGTDILGRDVLSRVIYGARPALLIAICVVLVAATVGTILGLIAGYMGDWIDEVIMRVCDLFLSFPPLLLALVAVSLLGPGLTHAALALVISWWPWYARLVRGEAQSLKSRAFVEVASAMGVSTFTIVRRHIFRNVTTPLIIQAAADLGTVILAAVSLAFIGLGAQPPQSDWGLMVADGRGLVFDQWWVATFPGLAIFITVLGFNLLGDGMRDFLDPRSQK